jgi:hypothetical protein
MAGIRFFGLLLLATAGCVSSRSVGYVDDDPGRTPFEKPPRAWTKNRSIIVEVGETRGPSKVAWIDYSVDDGNVYLRPYRISGGVGGTSRHLVDLKNEILPDDWRDHVYWATGESYYPVGHSAFWDRSLREPAHRTKIEFSPSPD